ncbi:MAG: FHA domain-containing protein, partial [Microcystis aeruginosa]
ASGPQIQIRLINEDEQPKLIIKSLEAPLVGNQTQPENDTIIT